MFCKKGVLRNFPKFTGKHLCQSLCFNKVPGLKPSTLLKKRPWHRCFPVNFAKFLGAPFLTDHLRWLLLQITCKIFSTQCSFTDHCLKHRIANKNNLLNTFSKSSLTISTLVSELFNCYDYFLRLSVFPDLFGKFILINVKFS